MTKETAEYLDTWQKIIENQDPQKQEMMRLAAQLEAAKAERAAIEGKLFFVEFRECE